MGTKTNKYIVHVDKDLEDIVPMFLDGKQKDISKLKKAVENLDYETIGAIGHKLKGAGGGYGFDSITEVGIKLELNAQYQDKKKIEKVIDDLQDYLNNLEIKYIEME